jgi:hypothetical protein
MVTEAMVETRVLFSGCKIRRENLWLVVAQLECGRLYTGRNH